MDVARVVFLGGIMALRSALRKLESCFPLFLILGLGFLFLSSPFNKTFSMGMAQASETQHSAGSEEADAAALKSEGADAKDAHAAEKSGENHAAAAPSEHAQDPKENPAPQQHSEHKRSSVSHGLSWFVGVFALVAILVFLFT
jgi:hypothetical protein